tara:strand:+ start:474 stop:2324 length:1851 start_codon:yes stop_codon:yes gene_type:complete
MAENDQKTKQELEQEFREFRKKIVASDSSENESYKSKMLEKFSKIYSDYADSSKLNRKSAINYLIKNPSAALSSSNLKNWGCVSDSLQTELERIVEENDSFDSVGGLIDHAIRMQLIWWGKKPEILMQEIESLIVTDEQKRYWENLQKDIREKVVALEAPGAGKEIDLKPLQKSISNCITKKIPSEHVKKNLIYDTYPILWKYYSRILPIKVTLYIINHIMEEQKVNYFEINDANLDRAIQLLAQIGNILEEYDIANGHKRNEKISTGFITKDSSGNSLSKIDGVKNRFKTHTVGKKSTKKVFENIIQSTKSEQPNTDKFRYEKFLDEIQSLLTACGIKMSSKYDEMRGNMPTWEDKKDLFSDAVKITSHKINESEGAFQGALNALDLVIPYQDKDVTRIYISKNGYGFLKLENKILNSLDQMVSFNSASKAIPELNDEKLRKYPLEIFSSQEVEFIMKNLIPTKLSLEYNIILDIISELKKSNQPLDSDKIEEIINNSCIDWAFEYPELFLRHDIDKAVADSHNLHKFSDSIKWITYPDDAPKKDEIDSWRIATMGRLAELGIVNWKMKKGENATGAAAYSKGRNFKVVKDLTKLSRREIIDSRDDYKKILQEVN